MKILITFLIIKARAQARAHPPGSNTTSLTFHEPNRLEPKVRLESNRLVNITMSKPEFDKHMINENQIIISDTIGKIESISTAGPCLALPHKNIDTFIVRTDASISEWVQH
jgi:hypothetical protein